MIRCTDDGFLSIDFTQLLGYPCQIAISPWQQGIHWTNTLESSKTTTCRYCQLGIPYQVLSREPKAEPWLKQIPEEIRPLLIEYESTYQGLIFPLLYHISRSQNACELFINQPRITFIALMYGINYNIELTDITKIFKLSLRKILGACGLPPYNSAVRFIRKLRLHTFGQEQYSIIRKLLLSRVYWKYRYCEKIDDDWLYPLIQNPELVKIPVVRTMAISYQDFKFIENMGYITGHLKNIAVEDIDNWLAKCRTVNQLIDTCVRLANQAEKERRDQLPDIKYGKPPFRGSEHIIPITTFKELAREGQNQGNCVEGYHDRIVAGECFAYTIQHPERATLLLSKDNVGLFEIDQIRIVKNGKPSDDTKSVVANWLDQSQNLIHGES